MRRITIFAIAVLLLAETTMSVHAATITVTNTNDSGPGSLRQAILSASSGDAINFAPSVTTVTLTSGELVIDKDLTITGPGANRLTVTANYADFVYFRIFNIRSSTVTVSMSGMTISNAVTGLVGGGGGGAGILSAGVLIVTDSIISGNNSGYPGGGGVLNDHGTMTITGCTISNNSEGEGEGGGGVLNDHGTMTITACTISNNVASQDIKFSSFASSEGGGISNHSGSLIITNSTISGNTCSSSSFDPLFPAPASAFGGGVDNSGSMTIANCTISGNSAEAMGISSSDTGAGGGISNDGNLQIRSSTIAHNSASGDDFGVGGGINGFQLTRTDSSIIALNSASTEGPDYFTNGGQLQSSGYNIIGNNADALISSQPTDQIGTPGAPIDPLLRFLADNGGPTLTHALRPGSPAINRGDPAAPPQDQRGYGRLGVPDVGAFEFNGIPPTPTPTPTPTFTATPTSTPTPTPTPGGPSLTIIQPNGGEVWLMGSVHEIKWDRTNLKHSDHLLIHYSRDGGASWFRIAQNIPAFTYSYWWQVDNFPTTQGRVKILLQADRSITDQSDANFTVQRNPYITLHRPNGGEVFTVGQNINIHWSRQNPSGNTVDIDYSTDNGTTWIRIATQAEDTGFYPWNVPGPATTTAKVRIRFHETPSVADTSEAVFTILSL